MKKILMMLLGIILVSCLPSETEREEREKEKRQQELAEIKNTKNYKILEGKHRLEIISEEKLLNGENRYSYFLFGGGGSSNMNQDKYVYIRFINNYDGGGSRAKIRWTDITDYINDTIEIPYIIFELKKDHYKWCNRFKDKKIQDIFDYSEENNSPIIDIKLYCSPKHKVWEVKYEKKKVVKQN